MLGKGGHAGEDDGTEMRHGKSLRQRIEIALGCVIVDGDEAMHSVLDLLEALQKEKDQFDTQHLRVQSDNL